MIKYFNAYREFSKFLSISIFDRLVNFSLLFFFARIISEEYFAFWTQSNSLPGILTGIITLGFGRSILRYMSENNYSVSISKSIIITSCIIVLLITFFSSLVVIYLNNSNLLIFMGGETRPYFGSICLILLILFESLFEILLNFSRARLSPIYIYYSFFRILPKVFLGFFLIFLNFNFWDSFLIYIFLNLIIIFFLFFSVNREINLGDKTKKFDIKEYFYVHKRLLKYSIPVTISAFAYPLITIIIRNDIVLSDGYNALGPFAIYLTFMGILAYLPEMFQQYSFPQLIRWFKTGNNKIDLFNFNFKITIIFTLFICLSFSLVGVYFLEIFYPKNKWFFIDSLFISLTALFFVLFYTNQRKFTIFYPTHSNLLILINFGSLFFSTFFVYFNFFSGPLKSIFVLFVYFLISYLIISLVMLLLKKKN